jgi:glycosyltransferase involved in cell wall biosynthesis
MIIALIHNYYQKTGGEDNSFLREAALLESNGHKVVRYTCHNDDLQGQSGLRMALNSVWNRDQYKAQRAFFREHQVEVAHFHNTFPILSPAGYHAAQAEGVAVVQTLHNYRVACLNAAFYREGRVCEDCLGRAVPWPGVLHACYRDSRKASAAVAATLTVHRLLSTYKKKVNVYIALNEFARRKYIQAGLPADRIVVKPSFLIPDPGVGPGGGGFVLFVGKVESMKGIDVLLAAHRLMGDKALPLKIVGKGPMEAMVEAAARELPNVEYTRRVDDVLGLMGEALVTVVPSVWYEGAPGVINESFAKGTPVLSSDIGGLGVMNVAGRTGRLFRPGDPVDLAAQLEWFATHPAEVAAMRREARAEFEAKYTAEPNYRYLMDIYAAAVRSAGRRVSDSAAEEAVLAR